jgi:beta-N-acetylhexosaminidase
MFKVLLNHTIYFLIFYFTITTMTIKSDWAASILSKMSLNEKLGQLFIIYSNAGEADLSDKLIKKYNIGSIIFGSGNVLKCFNRINYLQSISKFPLIISIDGEWGLNLRFSDVMRFPKNLTLGAIKNDKLIYDLGKEIGRQCALLGIHLNFAPVVDISTNPLNPIIGDRSFGDDKENVARKGIKFMQGLQDAGIIACAKHFCGHGDTDVDSHEDLPVIKHDINRIEDVELYPFKKIIDAGIKAVMSAHIKVICLDNRPITLSKKAMTYLLQEKLKFSGLIITDALNMSAISKYFKEGEAELGAFIAGNDLLMSSANSIPIAFDIFKKAIQDNIISEQEINIKVLKILKAKEGLGLDKKIKNKKIELNNFNSEYARQLKKNLFESAITVVRDNKNSIPLGLKNSVAYIQIGGKKDSFCLSELSKYYTKLSYYFIDNNALEESYKDLFNRVYNKYDAIIIGLFNLNIFYHLNNGLSNNQLKFLNSVADFKNTILAIFGTPYTLRFFEKFKTVLVAYEDDEDAQRGVAKIVIGKLKAIGELSISYNNCLRSKDIFRNVRTTVNSANAFPCNFI